MKKILFIRFSSIGDIVLTSPLVRCVKNQIVEKPEIHFITKRKYSKLVNNNPYIDKVYVFDKNVNEVINDLIKEEYDCIIDLHHNLRSIILRGKIGCLSYTFHKQNFNKWLLVNLKINKLPKTHVVDRYFEAVAPLNVINDGKGLDYFIPENEKVDFDLIPKSHRKNYLVYAIGGTYATKRLPTHKIISICQKIKKPIFILGGKEDMTEADKIKEAVGELVYNGCGIFTLNQSASIIEHALKVITHDTGMMHIASALKKEIISIWGNTVPDFGMYPYLPESAPSCSIIEVKNLSCRPCSKLGYNDCPKKHFKCMEDIDEQIIVDLVKGK